VDLPFHFDVTMLDILTMTSIIRWPSYLTWVYEAWIRSM